MRIINIQGDYDMQFFSQLDQLDQFHKIKLIDNKTE